MGWDDETWSQRQRQLEDSCRILSFFLGADLAKANDSTKTLSYKQISPQNKAAQRRFMVASSRLLRAAVRK